MESGNNAKRRTAVNGRKKIDIHSHPGDESQGASASDMKYINSRNNAVYLKGTERYMIIIQRKAI